MADNRYKRDDNIEYSENNNVPDSILVEEDNTIYELDRQCMKHNKKYSNSKPVKRSLS